MKPFLALASLGCVSCAAVQSVPAPAPVHDQRLAIYVGQRNLDEDDFEPVEEQATFGLEFAQESPGDPVGFELGLMVSSDDGRVGGSKVEAKTGEFYGGVHKSFGDGTVRPVLGAGLAVIRAEVDPPGGGSDDDHSLAAYCHGGVEVAVTDSLRLGLDLRILFGSDLEIGGSDVDADYGQLALVLAFGF